MNRGRVEPGDTTGSSVVMGETIAGMDSQSSGDAMVVVSRTTSTTEG